MSEPVQLSKGDLIWIWIMLGMIAVYVRAIFSKLDSIHRDLKILSRSANLLNRPTPAEKLLGNWGSNW